MLIVITMFVIMLNLVMLRVMAPHAHFKITLKKKNDLKTFSKSFLNTNPVPQIFCSGPLKLFYFRPRNEIFLKIFFLLFLIKFIFPLFQNPFVL